MRSMSSKAGIALPLVLLLTAVLSLTLFTVITSLGGLRRETARVQRAALSAFAPSFGGGTNEIQRNIIGERTLGLPREPGNDNDIAFRDLRRS